MFKLPDLNKPDETKSPIMYIRLYEELKQAIINREMAKDEKLPSKRKLAKQLGISIKSVENAYEQLLLEGFIYSVEKKGYYVSEILNYIADGKKRLHGYSTKYVQTEYMVNLRANRNSFEDFPVDTWSRLMRETLSENPKEIFEIVPFNGVLKLRQAIANHLRSFRGMEVSPDQIIISAGTEYMYNRLIQMFGAEAVYALPDPSSKRLRELYENNRLTYSVIAAEHGLDFEKLEQSHCNVLHISPAHQYPLGRVMPIQERIRLLNWVNGGKGRYIIEDDYDSEYVVAGKPIPPLYSVDINDKVIYMNTFAKSVSPAVRISYMVLPEALMQRYLETMSFYTCTVASVEQFTLAKFIEKNHLERYIHRMNKKNMQTRDWLLEGLQDLCSRKRVSFDADCAGTMILLKLHTTQPDREVKNFLKMHGIITSMMSEYYEDAEKQAQHAHIMVVNYSGLNPVKINHLCQKLALLLTVD